MDIFDQSLSIIMPAYNEGAYIYSNLMKTVKTVSGFHRIRDIWLVVKDTIALYASMKRKRFILNEKTTGI